MDMIDIIWALVYRGLGCLLVLTGLVCWAGVFLAIAVIGRG